MLDLRTVALGAGMAAAAIWVGVQYGGIDPAQVGAGALRTAVRAMMAVEEILGKEPPPQDYATITFYKEGRKIGAGGGTETVPLGCTLAEVDWCVDSHKGISLLRPDSELLYKLMEGRPPSEVVRVSEWKLLSVETVDSTGSVTELKAPSNHLVGDIVWDKEWRTHFGIKPGARKFRGIDQSIAEVEFRLGGMEVAESTAQELTK
jgi:hypothetical protein